MCLILIFIWFFFFQDKKFNEIINKGKSEKTEVNTKRDPLITQLKELFELQKLSRADHDVALAQLKVQQESLEAIVRLEIQH